MTMTGHNKDSISGKVIGAAIQVHKAVGPGLFESVYARCLRHELQLQGMGFEAEVPLPVVYRGLELQGGYRMDLVVENQLLVELKAVSEINDLHKAQLLTYLKLSGLRRGLLINFNVPLLKQGLLRMVL